MRVTLTTTDKEEALRMQKADDLCAMIWDFQQILRQYHRQGVPKNMRAQKLADMLYDEWFEQLNHNDINLDVMYS